MKTIMLVLTIMLSIVDCDAKVGQVPPKVLQSFMKQYPQSQVKDWTVKNDDWVAKFAMNKSKKTAYYLPVGKWVKTETKIPWTKDMPMAVDMSWKSSKFNNWYVSSIKEVQYPGRNLYVMNVQKDCDPEGAIPGDCYTAYRLYYDPNGTLERKTQVAY